ncbi:hypothetical protein [Butyrivibrio sp. MC2021]|uniref:hypothetical protein n=1 Tax=Butyrivibrio sp. MC2021 TaxID=1408306 RepID=UPI00047E2A94|nr:hypothetical protein [Butyrivibrio sp. MC2021]
MYGIFMECWVALKLYGGNWALLLIFLAAALYLVIKEENIKKKIMLGVIPILILAGFLVPVTKIVYVAVVNKDGDTYYRVLWLIPMYVVIGYAACKLIVSFGKKAVARIALVVILALIACTGSLVYLNQYVSVAENLYHIPNDVIEICDRIKPDEGQPRVRAAFPSDLVHFVRQYDTNILMPYGREMVVPQWDYYNPVYEVMEKPETIDAEELLKATRETKCSYIILANDRKIDKDLTEFGLKVLDTVGKYIIYADSEILEN